MVALTPLPSKRQRIFTKLRYLSNVLVLVGYFVLLNVDVTTGVIIRIISASIILPWMISNRIWDGTTVISIMTSIDIHKLLELLYGI